MLIPSLAVSVRRLHDIGKSGWYILLYLVPIVGTIILMFWFSEKVCQKLMNMAKIQN